VLANKARNREGVLGIAFDRNTRIPDNNLEGDYAQDIILPIVSESQIYQGDKDCVFANIRVSIDCTMNGQHISTTI